MESCLSYYKKFDLHIVIVESSVYHELVTLRQRRTCSKMYRGYESHLTRHHNTLFNVWKTKFHKFLLKQVCIEHYYESEWAVWVAEAEYGSAGITTAWQAAERGAMPRHHMPRHASVMMHHRGRHTHAQHYVHPHSQGGRWPAQRTAHQVHRI